MLHFSHFNNTESTWSTLCRIVAVLSCTSPHLNGIMFNGFSAQMSGRSSPTCIVADDSVLLALIVSSLLPSSKVITMFPGLRDKGFNYLLAVADANNFSMDRIKVIGKKASSLSMNDLKDEKVKAIGPMFLISFNSEIHIIVFMINE